MSTQVKKRHLITVALDLPPRRWVWALGRAGPQLSRTWPLSPPGRLWARSRLSVDSLLCGVDRATGPPTHDQQAAAARGMGNLWVPSQSLPCLPPTPSRDPLRATEPTTAGQREQRVGPSVGWRPPMLCHPPRVPQTDHRSHSEVLGAHRAPGTLREDELAGAHGQAGREAGWGPGALVLSPGARGQLVTER